MKKVLIFILNEYGGAEKVTLSIARMLMADGWQVAICAVCIDGKPDTIHERYPVEQVSNLRQAVESYTISYRGQLQFLRELYRTIGDASPDVVFCSAMHVNQRLLLLSGWFPKVRFVIRNDNHVSSLPLLKRIAMRITYPLADRVICQTKEMESEMVKIGVNKNRIITVNNPLDIEEIHRLASESNPYQRFHKNSSSPLEERTGGVEMSGPSPVFVAVGRVDRQKGFDILIRAFSKVRQVCKEASLFIVGDCTGRHKALYEELLDMVNRMELGGCVNFIGFKENPYPYMAHADVFVLSSRYEGLPNVLIEAQMLGVPCVATRCVPVVERIIEESVTGFIAETGDEVSLAKAMLKAISLSPFTSSYHPGASDEFTAVFNVVLKNENC